MADTRRHRRHLSDRHSSKVVVERNCMSDRNTRRVVGGLSAFAVAAGFAVTAGVGIAGAAPGSVTWTDGSSKYTRTVSNTTPNEGRHHHGVDEIRADRDSRRVHLRGQGCASHLPHLRRGIGQGGRVAARPPEQGGRLRADRGIVDRLAGVPEHQSEVPHVRVLLPRRRGLRSRYGAFDNDALLGEPGERHLLEQGAVDHRR